MKKRLKGLLALSMVVVMALAMTTGVASAATYYYGGAGDTALLDEQSVLPGDIVSVYDTKGSGGTSFALTNENGEYFSLGTGTVYSDNGTGGYTPVAGLHCAVLGTDGMPETYTIPANKTLGYYGYTVGLGTFYDKNYKRNADDYPNIGSLLLKETEDNLIRYDISYVWDGGSEYKEIGFTAQEPSGVIASSGDFNLKKDGYRFAGWKLTDGTVIPAGSNVKDNLNALMKNAGAPNDDMIATITLTAAWTPLDNSPAAGDTFPTAPLLMLMLMSAGAAVAVKRRKA